MSAKSRTRNVNADIDNTLFGSTAKHKKKAIKSSSGSSGLEQASAVSDFYSGGGSAGQQRTRSQRTMRLVNQIGIRDLTIRATGPTEPGDLILSQREFARIKENSRPIAETAAALAQTERAKRREQMLNESERRRSEFEEMDKLKKTLDNNEFAREAKERDAEILSSATTDISEQEEEVRQLKSKILQAKCMAIRDAQVQEKMELIESKRDEEARLDAMMENVRTEAMQFETEREQYLRERYIEGRKGLEDQIESNKQSRYLEEELREREAEEAREEHAKIIAEEAEEKRKRAEAVRTRMAEAVALKEQAILERQLLEEAQAEEDLRRVELMREQAEREREEHETLIKKRQEEARQLAETLKAAQRSGDQHAARAELHAKRQQIQKERDHRKNQLLKAAQEQKNLQALREGRDAQILEARKQRELQGYMDKVDFDRVVEGQIALKEHSTSIAEEAKERRVANRQSVLDQIKIKEKEARKLRAAQLEEGIRIEQEAQQRKQRIRSIKEKLLAEARDEGMTDNYLTDVVRTVNLEGVVSLK
eukprot:m.67284 g.67284  ORF g.67284 m.67284 type:complete len:539 (-) comp23791_c0_seq1:411-2027(-)